MVKFTIESVLGILVVTDSNGQVLPISVLDKHRMVSNPNQIGRRYWNEKWRCWSYEVLNVEPGTDVTGFISNE